MGYWSKDGDYVYDETDEKLRKAEETYTHNPTGEIGAGSIYDADQKKTEGIERMIQGQKEKDKPNQTIIDNLLKELPASSEDLKAALEMTGYRLDLMKRLVEGYRSQFIDIAKKLKDNFSPEANEMVNSKLTEYLCLIETLKSNGYQFGSTKDSYTASPTEHQYDPYKPEMSLGEAVSIMDLRRRNGANVDIIFPVNYNLDDPNQPQIDAVNVIDLVDKHLKDNPYIDFLWKKAGYGSQTIEESKGR